MVCLIYLDDRGRQQRETFVDLSTALVAWAGREAMGCRLIQMTSDPVPEPAQEPIDWQLLELADRGAMLA